MTSIEKAAWPWKRCARRAPAALGLHRSEQGSWCLVRLEQAADGMLRLARACMLEQRDAGREVGGWTGDERLLTWIADCSVPRPCTVVAGLSRSQVRMWRMTVPVGLEATDMEHMALMDAQGRHGLSRDAWCVDFAVAQPAIQGKEGVELVVVAAPRADVEGWQQLLRTAGLKLQVLEVAAHAARAAAMRAWRCQAEGVNGWHGIVLLEHGAGCLMWMRDGMVLEEQPLEGEALADLAVAAVQAVRKRHLPLRGLWLALNEAADEASLQRMQDALRPGPGGRQAAAALPEMQWLHPWAGMKLDDARLQQMTAAHAGPWLTACGLALRGADAWSN